MCANQLYVHTDAASYCTLAIGNISFVSDFLVSKFPRFKWFIVLTELLHLMPCVVILVPWFLSWFRGFTTFRHFKRRYKQRQEVQTDKHSTLYNHESALEFCQTHLGLLQPVLTQQICFISQHNYYIIAQPAVNTDKFYACELLHRPLVVSVRKR